MGCQADLRVVNAGTSRVFVANVPPDGWRVDYLRVLVIGRGALLFVLVWADHVAQKRFVVSPMRRLKDI